MSTSVLFVEDEQATLDELVLGYKSSSHAVYQALSGQQALNILQAHPIDILVMDVQLPDMDGLALIQRATEIRDGLQIILMSGSEERLLAIQAMTRYTALAIQKPVHSDELHICIKRCVAAKKVQKKLCQQEEMLLLETTHRKRREKAANRTMAIRIAISALLESSLEPLAFSKQVEVMLDIILTIPWLAGLQEGALFLMDESSGSLRMIGQKNLPELQRTQCSEMALGHCLCGKAAKQRKIIFTSQVDDDHVVRFDGMPPHGHYCVPIVGKKSLLGVLCLHLPAGHPHHADDDALLTTISHTLALILEHKQAEAELKKAGDQLRFMAYHDPLTGLNNRQYFDVTFNKVFLALQNTNRRQNEQPFRGAFLAILDIDHFKKVNDTYGHMMGDEVLVLFARIMNECFRDKDALFRFGGEEFVVLLNDVDADMAVSALNRFRTQVESYPFPQVGRVTVSIGAVRIEPGELAGTLIEKADKALYYSKGNGRNQVNLYNVLIEAGLLEDVSHETEEVDLW
ncbi:MAG: diguanylate cyclase [Magnetococcales bacterium]|nr:diguanylate cyclase [Magnetococcales bacterium]